MRELALFAGVGGSILAGKLLGWRTVCAVEFDPYCQAVLVGRLHSPAEIAEDGTITIRPAKTGGEK